MAYRRKQPFSRASTFKEDIRSSREDSKLLISRFSTFKEDLRSSYDSSSSSTSSCSSSSSLGATQAIRASSAHRDSSISSAYGESAYREPTRQRPDPSWQQDSRTYEYTSINSLNESKYGFWGVLARKAKSILEDDKVAQKFELPSRTGPQMLDTSTGGQFHQSHRSPESSRKSGSPKLQKGFDAITSSLNYLGDTIGNAFEEGLTIMETRTADIISETRKLHIRRKGNNSDQQNQANDSLSPQPHSPQMQTDQETQLKASRDVAMAMAAKAKLLLRELKTIKADLAFAKERCAQLEEENKIIRESREKGVTPEDDDLIRLQLETLLAEKGRLANENSLYARENRFLREVVEYHQLTMQDVVYLDEGIEEVTEVRPFPIIPITEVRLRPPSLPPPDKISEAPPTATPTDTVPDKAIPDALPVLTPPSGSPTAATPKDPS